MDTKRYYDLEPDIGFIWFSITDLNDEEKQYIRDLNIGICEEELEDDYYDDTDIDLIDDYKGRIIYTYCLTILTYDNVNFCHLNYLDRLVTYLKSVGFENGSIDWTDETANNYLKNHYKKYGR